jgi:hypothetical protein
VPSSTVTDALITEPDSDRVKTFAIGARRSPTCALPWTTVRRRRFRLVEAFGRERVGYVIEG